MGCDIHVYPEKRTRVALSDLSLDVWEYVYKEEKEQLGSYTFSNNYYGYNGRNYDLFSIIAGVRNYDNIGSTFEWERLIPADASDYVKARAWEWGGDGHSHNYLTLKELIEHDWSTPRSVSGLITAEMYKAWDKKAPQKMYWRGSEKVCYSAAEYDALAAKDLAPLDADVKVTWTVTDAELIDAKFAKMIERLKEIDPDPSNVRIVFFFDN